jgi:hypothetical protein
MDDSELEEEGTNVSSIDTSGHSVGVNSIMEGIDQALNTPQNIPIGAKLTRDRQQTRRYVDETSEENKQNEENNKRKRIGKEHSVTSDIDEVEESVLISEDENVEGSVTVELENVDDLDYTRHFILTTMNHFTVVYFIFSNFF